MGTGWSALTRQDLLSPKGSTVLLMGNEAIARGALEAGICFAAAYPGTPSTEIMEALASVAKDAGIYVEWSANEKVAFEAAYAAAMSYVKSLTTMKHVGVNVAADILMSSAYAGVNAGFVIVSADDPGQHSSQNEQDNRWYGMHAHIPVVEPSSPRDAYKLIKAAYMLSEKYKHPVLFRSTTRISHTRQPVTFEQDIPLEKKCKGRFDRDIERWVLVPAHGRKQKKRMMEVWRKVAEDEGVEPFIRIINPGMKKAIIAGGIAYSHVMEALELLGKKDEYTVVKVSLPVPLPYKPILRVLKEAQEVLVVEELDPVLEMQIKKIAYDNGVATKIRGKDIVPINGELDLDSVARSILSFEGREPIMPWKPLEPLKLEPPIPARPPVMCAGCPHRNTYYIVKTAANKAGLKDPIFTGDIGCYTLGYEPPFYTQMTSLEMGGSIGVAHGLSKVVDEPVIAVIGDSTFYHAGLPPSINIVYNKGHAVVLVLDNQYTAMTGHQPHPGTGLTAMGEPAVRVPIEKLLETMGYKTYVINPMNVKESINIVAEAFKKYKDGEQVAIVSRMKCALQAVRKARKEGIRLPVYHVVEDKCTGCMVCVKLLACPAIVVPKGAKKPKILTELCVGCGLCAQVCPFNAIEIFKEGSPNWLEAWK